MEKPSTGNNWYKIYLLQIFDQVVGYAASCLRNNLVRLGKLDLIYLFSSLLQIQWRTFQKFQKFLEEFKKIGKLWSDYYQIYLLSWTQSVSSNKLFDLRKFTRQWVWKKTLQCCAYYTYPEFIFTIFVFIFPSLEWKRMIYITWFFCKVFCFQLNTLKY